MIDYSFSNIRMYNMEFKLEKGMLEDPVDLYHIIVIRWREKQQYSVEYGGIF